MGVGIVRPYKRALYGCRYCFLQKITKMQTDSCSCVYCNVRLQICV